ncbi:hypothetical protein [Streptomyces goshikiensis]|uniref:hypothetical protein n=1 Tax=Streptomyces goshikiensis TaxID=1942 RepID=UPI003667C316
MPIRTNGTDLEGAQHGLHQPSARRPHHPHQYSDDPDGLTLYPAYNHGYDHHDYMG